MLALMVSTSLALPPTQAAADSLAPPFVSLIDETVNIRMLACMRNAWVACDLIGEWVVLCSASALPDSRVPVGDGQHFALFTAADGEVLLVQARRDSLVRSDEDCWMMLFGSSSQLDAADSSPTTPPPGPINCVPTGNLRGYSLTGDCWTGLVWDPASQCQKSTCGAGSGGCTVTWTYNQANGGTTHNDQVDCGVGGHFQICGSNICWNFGDGS